MNSQIFDEQNLITNLILSKNQVMELVREYSEKNPTDPHPFTNALKTVGLNYSRMCRNGTYSFEVVAHEKFFLFKIKNGI